MAQDRRFSHITVNAADDDDVVIQAGAYGRHQGEDVLEEAVYAEPEPQVVPVAVPEPQHAAQQVPAGNHAAKPHAAHARKPETAVSDSRTQPVHRAEQTLEDLDAGPMSGMQKAVLVGVGVVIIAAIVYFALFMR
ncbi:hypothetical protein [Senegalimassilia anaerobia]|uniref:SURF2 Surfeit locus protein 2 n=1 Tax=Senegalimassilia anaerobia TaxID=1473216 RepID=A0A369LAJ5_9ACTN|nr:hypothetical protein [Senegalimassilia anaerobia]RDB56112.1 hypothetical protein C1880_04265 [Senegalimassilia anaerobia]